MTSLPRYDDVTVKVKHTALPAGVEKDANLEALAMFDKVVSCRENNDVILEEIMMS